MYSAQLESCTTHTSSHSASAKGRWKYHVSNTRSAIKPGLITHPASLPPCGQPTTCFLVPSYVGHGATLAIHSMQQSCITATRLQSDKTAILSIHCAVCKHTTCCQSHQARSTEPAARRCPPWWRASATHCWRRQTCCRGPAAALHSQSGTTCRGTPQRRQSTWHGATSPPCPSAAALRTAS